MPGHLASAALVLSLAPFGPLPVAPDAGRRVAAVDAPGGIGSAAAAVSYAAPHPVGARRPARDAASDGAPRWDAPRRRGGTPACSVGQLALLSGAAGAAITVLFWGALGHNTGQHVAWGAVITGGMAGSGAFLGALCPRGAAQGLD